MPSCQRCRQPLASLPSPSTPHSSSSSSRLDDSHLSPSTYDWLSASDRLPHPPQQPPTQQPRSSPAAKRLHPLYSAASRPTPPSSALPHSLTVPQPHAPHPHPHTRLAGPTDSFVVLTASVIQPPPSSSSSSSAVPSSTDAPDSSSSSTPRAPSAPSAGAAALTPHLSQLSSLYALLSSSSSLDHPLCTECMDTLLALMARELDEGKKERDRLVGFEKEVIKRRDDAVREGAPTGVQLREALERDIGKLKKAESHAIAELKAVEARKQALAAEAAALDAEEAELAREEAEFWTAHSRYLIQRDELQDRESALAQRLARAEKELEKLAKTNVYNDAFCIGQESGLGTINSLRFGRLPSAQPPVDFPELNAAWGHVCLLLHTLAGKFRFRFDGYRLVPCGSFSRVEKLVEGGKGEWVAYELYGSSDFAVTRLLQNRRFDLAMVAFLECLRQLGEWVASRDRAFRLHHPIVKDRIGDVSIKLQFGSDEAWTRALKHVLLDLKMLLGRASR